MSSVDKFGRPLRNGPADSRRSAIAVTEGVQLDTDRHFNVRERRIKNLADPEDESDATNKKWVSARLNELEIKLMEQDTIDKILKMIDALSKRIEDVENVFRALIEQTEPDLIQPLGKRIKTDDSGPSVIVLAKDDADRYDLARAENRR